MKHTTTPWTFSVGRWPNGELSGTPYIYAPNAREHPSEGRHVATLCKLEEVEANAQFITMACNHHEELVEALETIAPLVGAMLGRLRFSTTQDAEILPLIQSLLTKLKG